MEHHHPPKSQRGNRWVKLLDTLILFLSVVFKVEGAISPGITMLNWNSLNIPAYISNVYSRLREVDLLVKQVNDIRDARIDAVLREISETVFCDLPKDDPWTIDEFIAKTQVTFSVVSIPGRLLAVCFFS